MRHLLLLVTLLPGVASAIVNIESMRVETEGEGVSGSFSLTANGTSGNSDTSNAGLGAYIQNKRGERTDFAILTYNYGSSDGEKNVDRTLVHLRHVQGFAPRRAWEAFAQWQKDEFKRLSHRELIGGGLRWDLNHSRKADSRLYIGAGAFYESERLDQRAGTTDAGTDTTVRGNFYLSLQQPLNEHATLASTTYFQPSLEHVSDRRFVEQGVLFFEINESTRIKISVDVSYDSEPPQDVKKTDVTYTTGIDYSF
jgi:putative salt-induced outer membrane protein YdiY